MNSIPETKFRMRKEIITSQPATISTQIIKKKRDPENYIKAARKNPWIQHVKNVGKKNNLSYKEALKKCKVNKKKKF